MKAEEAARVIEAMAAAIDKMPWPARGATGRLEEASAPHPAIDPDSLVQRLRSITAALGRQSAGGEAVPEAATDIAPSAPIVAAAVTTLLELVGGDRTGG